MLVVCPTWHHLVYQQSGNLSESPGNNIAASQAFCNKGYGAIRRCKSKENIGTWMNYQCSISATWPLVRSTIRQTHSNISEISLTVTQEQKNFKRVTSASTPTASVGHQTALHRRHPWAGDIQCQHRICHHSLELALFWLSHFSSSSPLAKKSKNTYYVKTMSIIKKINLHSFVSDLFKNTNYTEKCW